MFPAIRVLSSTPKWKVKDVLNTSKIHLESIHHAEPFPKWVILEDSSILKPSFQLLRSFSLLQYWAFRTRRDSANSNGTGTKPQPWFVGEKSQLSIPHPLSEKIAKNLFQTRQTPTPNKIHITFHIEILVSPFVGGGPFQSPRESCLPVRLGTEGNFVRAISHDRDVWCDATPVKPMANDGEGSSLKTNFSSKHLNN